MRYGDTVFVLALASGERITIPVAESHSNVAAVLGLVRDGDSITLSFSEEEDEGHTVLKYEQITINGAAAPWATADE